MFTNIFLNAMRVVNSYLLQNYTKDELEVIKDEISFILGTNYEYCEINNKVYSYETVQEILSKINEKEDIRKTRGVYYTPTDVVKFIVFNSIKLSSSKLRYNNLHVLDLNGIPHKDICYEKVIFDPTCGTGVFLLSALEIKLDLLDLHYTHVTKEKIFRIISTIRGNDVNIDSIKLTKMRILLNILHRYGVTKVVGISKIMETCFTSYDFISTTPDNLKYDIIIGNPPYVEDGKSISKPLIKYGNIYANVLENATSHLNTDGVIGFIIPLSYVATPRMKRIRKKISTFISEQYILSYSDRPDCLFSSVHQKLCIILGRNNTNKKSIYTSNYKYWYKEERQELFHKIDVIKNNFIKDEYIPKLGTDLDINVYKKINKYNTSLMDLLEENSGVEIYLNMRAAFWIKAFLSVHDGSEYKAYKCKNREIANFCMCLLNSTLFWWYWICISDCWHITRKELNNFMIPQSIDFNITNRLAVRLEEKLEETKLYVGTKQTKYEYKHKDCVEIIHEIDDYINRLYKLTDEESIYIENFSYRYRIGGGAISGSN